jgi:hypothetical protein
MEQEDLSLDAPSAFAREPDEIDEVLAALRSLLARASSPIVRACLEDAHDDIAHLTGRDGGQGEDRTEAA